MLYKLKAVGNFQGNAIEHTYEEMVQVKNGIAICKTKIAKDALYVRGYDLIEEIPLELNGQQGIPNELYTLKKYREEEPEPQPKPVKEQTLPKQKAKVKTDLDDLNKKELKALIRKNKWAIDLRLNENNLRHEIKQELKKDLNN